MVQNLTPSHHPSLFSTATFRNLFMSAMMVLPCLQGKSQEITGLDLVRTLSHSNYSVQTLDTYFEDGRQLIAYSNASGSGDNDTLIVYDFETDQVLLDYIAETWYFTIDFVNSTQLLFSNNNKLYRLTNFNPPNVTEVDNGVRTFKLSDDNSTIAILKNGGTGNLLEVSAYNSNTGSLSSTETFDFPDLLDNQASEITFSPDGQFIAINGGYDHDYVVIINTTSGEITSINTPENQGAYSPAFYDDNGTLYLAVGGGYLNGNIELIDVESLAHENSTPVFNFYMFALDFDPAMEHIATGGYDGTIKVLRTNGTDFEEVAMTYIGGNINELAFTADNEYLVAALGPSNAEVRIYRIERAGTATQPVVEIRDQLYPNPANDIINLNRGYNTPDIYDFNGRCVARLNPYELRYDISALTPGLYCLKAMDEHGIYTMRFIKL